MGERFNPFKNLEPRQRGRTLQDELVDAHGRYLNDNGLTPDKFSFNQYVEGVQKQLDAVGHGEKAKVLRDWRAQKRIAGRGGDMLLDAMAEVGAAGGRSQLTGAMRDLGVIGPRNLEETLKEESTTTLGQDIAGLGTLGFLGYSDTKSLGAGRFLRGLAIEGRRALGLMPEELGDRSGFDIADAGSQAIRQDLVTHGTAPWLVSGVEKGGQLLGLFGATGYVNRFGDVLKASPIASRGMNMLGRALQNPAVNLVATEGLISEGEIQFSRLAGEDEREAALRSGQGARLANAAVFGALMPAAQLFGRFAERGLLRFMTTGAERATFMSKAISEAPSMWLRARAGLAHVAGKAAEFQAFGLVPQIYRPTEGGETELSPWLTTILNPVKIAGALSGKGDDARDWTRAVVDVVEHLGNHWKEEAVAGTIVGAAGLRGSTPIGGKEGTARDFFREGLGSVGPRSLTGEAREMGARGELMTPQQRSEHLAQAKIVRAARKGLTPEERRSVNEALEKGLENLGSERPEAVQAVINYVVAGAEAQRRYLAKHQNVDRKLGTVPDQVRRYLEEDLGSDIFAGPLKTDRPGLGITVEIMADPARPNQEGRKGEVLRVVETTPPGRADPRPIKIAHIRFEDGKEGVVGLEQLRMVDAPPDAMPLGIQGERPADIPTPHVGTLPETEIGRAPGAGTAEPGVARPERVAGRLERGEVGKGKILEGARRMVEEGDWGSHKGLQEALRRRFKLTEEESLAIVEDLAAEGKLSPEVIEQHNQRLIDRFYGPPGKVKVRGGNVIRAYRSMRRSLARADKGGKQNTGRLLGRLKHLWDKMTPAQREAALRGVVKNQGLDFLPHERGSEVPGRGALPHILRLLGEGGVGDGPGAAQIAGKASDTPAPAPTPSEPTPTDRRATDAPGTLPGAPRGRRRADYEVKEGDSEEVIRLKRRLRRQTFRGDTLSTRLATDAKTGLGSDRAWQRAQQRIDSDPDTDVAVIDLTALGIRNNFRGEPGGDLALKGVGDRLRALGKELGLEDRLMFRAGEKADEFVVAGTPEAIAKLQAKLNDLGGKDGLIDRMVLPDGTPFENRLVIGTGKDFEAASADMATAKGRWSKHAKEKGLETDKDRVKQFANQPEGKEKAPPEGKKPPPEEPKDEPKEEPDEKGESADVVEPPEGAPSRPSDEIPAEAMTPGADVEVRQEGTKDRVKGRYAFVPVESLLPSHDPSKSFSPSEGYPESLQPRPYHSDTAEQAKVHEIAGGFDPAQVVNTSPRADQGPPSVAYDAESGRFVVLNGNGRAMGMRLALENPADRKAYERYLEQNAKTYGIEGDAGGQALVRVVDMHPNTPEAKRFARFGNRPASQPQRPIDRAASEAALIPDELLNSLASDPDLTPAEAINGPKGAALRKDLAHRMGKAGNDLFHDDLTLTEAGKEFMQNVLLVKSGISADSLNRLSKRLRRTVSAGAAQLANLRRNPKTKDMADRFSNALDWVNRHLEGGRIPVADYAEADPAAILDVKAPVPKTLEDRAFVYGISKYADSPKRMRDALSRLVQDREAEGQGMLLDPGEKSDFERTAEAFGLEVSEPVAAIARDAEQAPLLGMPGPLDGEMQHHLTPEMRGELGAPDPIRGQSNAPVGGLRLPLSLEQADTFSGDRAGQAQIVENMARTFGVPIRVGRSTSFRGGKVLGHYNTWTHVVRMKNANNIVVASHEVGHSIESRVFSEMAKEGDWKAMRAEMYRAGEALYGSKEPSNGYTSEGFAEFMRVYLTQPDLLKAHFPKTSRWFEDNFAKGDKKFHRGLSDIRKMSKDYAEQGFHNRLLSTIVKGKTGPTPLQKTLRFFSKEKWWDELTPIQKLVELAEKDGIHLDPHKDPFQLADFFRNTSSARAQFWAERGMTDAAGRKVGPALADAASIVAQSAKKRGIPREEMLDRFRTYLIAKRSVDLARRGIRSENIDMRDALHAIKTYERDVPEFLKAGEVVWEWNRSVLSFMRQLGAISHRDYKNVLSRSRYYVPFQRVLPNEVRQAGAVRADAAGRPLRGIRGSSRDIRDPFPIMVSQAAQMIRFAQRRAVMMRLADLAQHPHMGKYIEKVDPDIVRKAKPLESFREELERAGVDLGDVDMAELITWYEPKAMPDGKDPIIPVVGRNGKLEWYQVTKDIYSALSASDAYRLPGALDLFLGVPARLKRLGTTGLRASFSLVTNPVRDFFTMMVQSQSKNPLEIIPEWVRGQVDSVKALFGKKSHYGEFWSAVGGEMAQPLGQDLSRTFRLGENLGRGRLGRIGADIKKGHLIQATGDALDALRDILQTPEAGPRIAELRMVGKRVGHKPSEWESLSFEKALDQAIQMKRGGAQVTVDFAAAGKYARVMNAAIPFFNVAIQGPRAFMRAWRRNRAATSLIGLGLTAATLQLWWKNKDEDWYKDMPWAEKFGYWHISDGDVRIRIPRPFEIGLAFATIPEAVLDSEHRKDPEAVKAALAHSYETLMPDFFPVLAQEYIEQAKNKDEFRNRPIVPKGESDRPAEEQFGPSTTNLAKGLGKFLGWSPRRIDHAVEGLFGGVGRDLMKTFGTVTPSTRESQLSDLPIVGRLFSIDGVQGYSSQRVQDFFELRTNLQERRASRANPITPQERAALRILERAAKRLRVLRDQRSDKPDLAGRSEMLIQMREVAETAIERAQALIAPDGNGEGAKANPRPRASPRRLFTPR